MIRVLRRPRLAFSPSCSTVISTGRNISVSVVRYQEADHTYEQFIGGIGKQFENANRPRNWLGGEVPFPMNPSFKPPIPISDVLRTTLYKKYMTDPIKNNVRELARQHHLSIKRVDAILRLKGHEESWVKENKPLQTGFRAGMEMLLGVEQNEKSRHGRIDHDTDSSRSDVDQADALEEDEGRDLARQKYQRMFWESIPEGDQEPVMPTALRQAREDADKLRQLAKTRKSHLMLRSQDKPRQKPLVVSKPGRPAIKFVDVGGKFIDVPDRLRRMAESERRASVKARKRKKAMGQ